MNKKQLSERDICTKVITPSLRQAGWDEITQLREEVSFTKGRIIVRGKLVTRGKAKRADYILYYKPNIPLAVKASDVTFLADTVRAIWARMEKSRWRFDAERDAFKAAVDRALDVYQKRAAEAAAIR